MHIEGHEYTRHDYELIAKEGKEIIGGVSVRGYKIWSLEVTDKYRECGIATTLLLLAESAIRSKGHTHAWLTCYDEKLEFYAHRGWKIDEIRVWSQTQAKYMFKYEMVKELWG